MAATDESQEQRRLAGLEYHRAWRAALPVEERRARRRAAYLRHREAESARAKEYYRAHSETIKERSLKYHVENPDKKRESDRKAARRSREEDPAKYLCATAKRRAKQLGIEFSISKQDVVVPETCPALGVRLDLSTGRGYKAFAPSIDRIDPTKGYIPGNVQVLSVRANALKRRMPMAEFMALVVAGVLK